MTKPEMDQEFTQHYQELEDYATKYIRLLGLSMDPSDCLTGSYLHCHQMMHEIQGASHFLAVSKNWIKMNLRWWNSPLRRELTGRPTADLEEVDPSTSGDPNWDQIDHLTHRWQLLSLIHI